MASSPENTPQTYIALLRDFESEVESVSLENGVTIRRLNLETDTDEDSRFGFVFEPEEAFVLVYQPAGTSNGKELEVLNNTVTAMRITAPGAVSIGQLLKPQTLRIVGPRFPVPPYQLTKESVDTLSKMTVRLPNASSGSVRVAISRFDLAHERTRLAYERDESEDRFIDYWIALEALFSPNDKREATYRIALRLSHFIAGPGDEREEMYLTTLDSYDVRSQIVHGRKLTGKPTKKRKLSPRQIVDRTEDYLRRCLRKIVLSDQGFHPEAIDIAIARGN